MRASRKKQLTTATVAYIFLLLYILAALVWWFISLQQQSNEMADLKLELLKKGSISDPKAYQFAVRKIEEEKRRAHGKYISEGATFLILSLLGAFFVYRSVRKQIRLQQQERNFMMAITHELKTPIAISKLNLETLQKHKLDDTKQQKLIAMTLQETNRLNNLTNNILVSSQLEGGRYNRTEDELDLSALTASCVEDFRHRFTEIHWQAEIEPDIDLVGDALLLQILINNLLENAVKYSARQSTIGLKLSRLGKKAILSIADNGIGIPDQEKELIFEKFYRIGSEETRTTKGTGLGLYLCRKIATDHNADIEVTNNSPTGSNFIVTFHELN
jgi:two-component system, OmpR family, sensor histidine kinase CiaH